MQQDDLPPLPAPDLGMPWRVNAVSDGTAHSGGFTYEQMRAYALQVQAKERESRSAAMCEVEAERKRQDAKWGGQKHDDEHSTAEFVQLIEDYAGWARTMAGMDSHDKAERRLIQVAALAVAAVESSRRRRGA